MPNDRFQWWIVLTIAVPLTTILLTAYVVLAS